MNIVERPNHTPGQCAATLTDEDPKGFIDTGLTPPFVDPRIYISVSWVIEAATELGMVPGEEMAQAEIRIKDLEAQHSEDSKLIAAAEHTLTHLRPRKSKQPIKVKDSP